MNNAKEKELKKREDNIVFEILPYKKKGDSVRWVHSFKENPDGVTKPKARLVKIGLEDNRHGAR